MFVNQIGSLLLYSGYYLQFCSIEPNDYKNIDSNKSNNIILDFTAIMN